MLRAMMLMVLCATAVTETWAKTYKLQKVTSVASSKLYVFEQDGYVMKNTIESGALQCTNSYKTEGLTGTESYVWQLVSDSPGYNLLNISKNFYLGNTNNNSNLTKGNTNHVWTFKFQDDGTCIIQNTGETDSQNKDRFLGYTSATSHAYKSYAKSNLNSSSYPHAINVYQLVEEETKTLNGSGYATYCSQNALDFTDYATADYSAWQITGVDGRNITFSQITSKVTKGTGMLLKGVPGATISLHNATGATALDGNLLEGITADTDVNDNEYYGLSGRQFVKVNAGTVPSGKALLPAEVVTGEVKGFTFIFDSATGVRTIEHVSAEKTATLFNLSGQRLQKMQRGVNIVNGKKVLVKN